MWNTAQEVKASFPSVEGVKQRELSQHWPGQALCMAEPLLPPPLGRIRVCLWQGSHTGSLIPCCQMFLQQRKLLDVQGNYHAPTSSLLVGWLTRVSKETLWPWLHQDHISHKGDFTEVSFEQVFLTSGSCDILWPCSTTKISYIEPLTSTHSFEKPWSASTIGMVRKEKVIRKLFLLFLSLAS